MLSFPSSQLGALSTFASSLPCDPASEPRTNPSDLFSIHTANRSFPFSSQSSEALQPNFSSQPHANYGWTAQRTPAASFTSSFGFSEAPGFSARVTVNSYASPSASSSTNFFPRDTRVNVPSHALPSSQPPTASSLVQLAAILQWINRPPSNINTELQLPPAPAPRSQPHPLSQLPESTASSDSFALLHFLESALSSKARDTSAVPFPSGTDGGHFNTFANTNSNAFHSDSFLPLQSGPFPPVFPHVPSAQPFFPLSAPAPPAPSASDPQLAALLDLFVTAKARAQCQAPSPAQAQAQAQAASEALAAATTGLNAFGAPTVSLNPRPVASPCSNLNQSIWNEFSASSDVPMVPSTNSHPTAAPCVKPEPMDAPSSPTPSESTATHSSEDEKERAREAKRKSASTRVKKERIGDFSRKKKRRGHLHRSGRDLEFLSEIVCGRLQSASNNFTVKDVQDGFGFEPFFGREVEVFTAVKDPERRPLYQTTELTRTLKCSNNMLAMYLARRKGHVNSGIYQATAILYKRNCRKDVKCSGYFITLDACKRFAEYLNQRKVAAEVKAEEQRLVQETQGQIPLLDSSPADSVGTATTESSAVAEDRLVLPASVQCNHV